MRDFGLLFIEGIINKIRKFFLANNMIRNMLKENKNLPRKKGTGEL